MDNHLKKLAQVLLDSYEKMYNLCYPEVERIINYQITDIDLIEHTLDITLDIYTEKGFNLFIYLLLYYRTVNLEKANEYLKILKESREEEYVDFVKKLRR